MINRMNISCISDTNAYYYSDFMGQPLFSFKNELATRRPPNDGHKK